MDYLYYSVFFFNIATFGYLAITAAITFALVKKKTAWLNIFAWFGALTLLMHTLALGLRWVEAGFDRPPWTNLYESLIFFSWGLALLTTVATIRYKTHFLATFLYPLVFAGLGLASLVPDKSITPLVPSLQSYWIKIHVVMAVFAYPGFIIAGVASLAYLFRSKTRLSSLTLGVAVTALFFMFVGGGYEAMSQQQFSLPIVTALEDGSLVKIPMDPEAQPVEWVVHPVPYAGVLFLLTMLATLGTILNAAGERRDPENPQWIKMRRWFYFVSVVLMGTFLGSVYTAVIRQDEFALISSPYQMAVLDIVFAVQFLFLLYSWKRDAVDSRLPAADWLDGFSYSMTLFAFPFMTLLLITGAIWAYSAWGRYWGWDPKETCALITWLIFAGYLHSRKYFGNNAAPSAVISIIGAISVFFTFLGANLLLSGLHSYGAQ